MLVKKNEEIERLEKELEVEQAGHAKAMADFKTKTERGIRLQLETEREAGGKRLRKELADEKEEWRNRREAEFVSQRETELATMSQEPA